MLHTVVQSIFLTFFQINYFCLGQYYSIISTNEDSYDVASNSTGITTRNAANIVESKTVLTTAATNESDLESNQVVKIKIYY